LSGYELMLEPRRKTLEEQFEEILEQHITWRECLPEAIALNSAEITNGSE
jgi:hypothetical protein